MNHVARGQLTCSGQRRLTNRDGPMRIALLLNRRSPTAPDCTSDATTENQFVVGSVDDCVHLLFD